MTFLGVLQFVEDPPWSQQERRTAPRTDFLGIFFIGLALGCMEIATDRGEDYDWLGSGFIRLMFGLSAAGYLIGIPYLLYARNPIVNLRVFKDRNFALGCLQIGIMGFVLYASAVLIPQFAQEQLGYTATLAGLVLAPGAVVLTMLIPIAGKVMNVVPAKYVIASGGLALGAALLYSMNLVPDLDFWHLVGYRAAQTAALALLFVPISTIAYTTVPRELNGDAAALFSMARNMFGGIGISVSTALITDHLQIRQSYLIGHLSPTNQPYNDLLQRTQHALVDTGQSMAQAVQAAPGQIYQMLQGQVAVLAYNDVFLITACLAFVMIPTALLMTGVKPKSSGGGH
jgi:DHA2 family multidrug resistance protein